MSHFQIIVFLVLLAFTSFSVHAQTFVGSGPDPACGGSELSITKKQGDVSLIKVTIFASNRTLIEQHRPLPNGNWQIKLLLYSAQWQKDESPAKDKLLKSATFVSSDIVEGNRLREAFGYGDVVWSGEPKRLLNYFQANRSDFTIRVNEADE